MPEGPEIKTVARTLAREIVGRKLGPLWHSHLPLRNLVNYEALKTLENLVVEEVSCYGKILFIHTQQEPRIFVQLGMTGQLVVTSVHEKVATHTHMRWQLKDCFQ